MVLYCLAYYSICRFCNVFRRIFGLFLHVEMLIAFSRRLVEWRLCSKLCSSLPPPSLSFWNCSKITRECLKERGGKKKGFRTHRLNDGFYLVCLLSLSLAVSVCYVGFYGEKHRPCQTWLVQGRKKEACAGMRRGGSGGGVARETRFQELRGCGITVSKTRQTKVYVQ